MAIWNTTVEGKSIMKKFVSLLLCVTMIISIATNSYASTNIKEEHDHSLRFTKEEILQLEEYVSVDKNGFFVLDSEKALKAGFEKELIAGQEDYFVYLNGFIVDDIMEANKNLEITVLDEAAMIAVSPLYSQTRATHAYNCGGGELWGPVHYWWGHRSALCDCGSNKISADLGSCAAISGVIAVLAGSFNLFVAIPPGLGVGYFWLVASRIDSNNQGHGVFMDITWAYYFDIEPQP